MKEKVLNNNRTNSAKCKILLLALFIAASLSVKAQENLTVIGNQTGSPSELRFSELRSVFMGEKQRWKGGVKITIALMKTNTAAGKNTSRKIYDMSGDELNKFWLALVFQGKAQAPLFFNSAVDLQNYVAKNPGAIGILDQVVSSDEIKTISIEGKKSF
jgi:hypothetical protein